MRRGRYGLFGRANEVPFAHCRPGTNPVTNLRKPIQDMSVEHFTSNLCAEVKKPKMVTGRNANRSNEGN